MADVLVHHLARRGAQTPPRARRPRPRPRPRRLPALPPARRASRFAARPRPQDPSPRPSLPVPSVRARVRPLDRSQARELLSHLPIDSPTDCYISKLVLEGFVTAVVATPAIAEQRDPYAKGDIKHTNVYKWDK